MVTPVCFALFFHNFSTWLGRRGLYLEDLFVRPEVRGKGYGRALLVRLAQIALERDCGRMEWAVLDWNEPAIQFYRKLGARPNDEWTIFRLTGDGIAQLAMDTFDLWRKQPDRVPSGSRITPFSATRRVARWSAATVASTGFVFRVSIPAPALRHC